MIDSNSFWRALERAVMIATLASIFLAAWTYIIDIEERRLSRQDNKAQAIDRAWNRLLAPVVGNTGKSEALTYLVKNKQDLTGINLSCAYAGGTANWSQNNKRCQLPVDLSGGDYTGVNLAVSDLSGVNLEASEIQGGALAEINLSGASLVRAKLNQADLTDALLIRANVEYAEFVDATLFGTDFTGSHLSGSDFSRAKGLSSANFENTWAWSDRPPKGLERTRVKLCKYDAFQHHRNLLPTPCLIE